VVIGAGAPLLQLEAQSRELEACGNYLFRFLELRTPSYIYGSSFLTFFSFVECTITVRDRFRFLLGVFDESR
jgi:hypothetical protein